MFPVEGGEADPHRAPVKSSQSLMTEGRAMIAAANAYPSFGQSAAHLLGGDILQIEEEHRALALGKIDLGAKLL